MRLFLLYLSILSLLLLPSTAVAAATAPTPTDTLQCVSPTPPRYSFQLETPKACVSGFLITADIGNDINGSLVNEFGISAADFTFYKQKNKLKLLNTVSFLNKWYIKRVLTNDLALCVRLIYNLPSANNKNYDIVRHENVTTVYNRKRKITYTFAPITPCATDPGNETEQ